jgi:hypothetical protein
MKMGAENNRLSLTEKLTMNFADEEILIPMINLDEFNRAKDNIVGLGDHYSYEDYLYEREGRLMGLTFAGQKARIVKIPTEPFLSWSISMQRTPTIAELDLFAALIEFRAIRKAQELDWRTP